MTFPAGNYAPPQIARYLNDQLYPEVETVCWDASMLVFRFCPGINVLPDSTAASLLGFKSGTAYTNATESALPANVLGPQQIIVETNLSLFNIPISGRLCVVPIQVPYGQVIHYNNWASTCYHLCMQHYIDNIQITLTDESGEELAGYDEIPWSVLISFEPMDNPGFQI